MRVTFSVTVSRVGPSAYAQKVLLMRRMVNMTKADLLKSIDELLNLPEGTVKGSEKLDDIAEWDSMALVMYMSLADEKAGVKLAPRQLGACVTVNDLVALVPVEG